ncbi:hypothetical protein [uncultured Deefgea sp.]|uniref:hypothetical protein n=1 Tax=uncultured Deefgea sp. TaxID=1304914 RepID=UPI0026233875|nr:hypothetical protein [uncultured Deefgea sp.]
MPILRVFFWLFISFSLSLNVAAAKELPSTQDHHTHYHNEIVLDHHDSTSASKAADQHSSDSIKTQGSHCNTCTSAMPLLEHSAMLSPLRSVQNAAKLAVLSSINSPPPLRPPFLAPDSGAT